MSSNLSLIKTAYEKDQKNGFKKPEATWNRGDYSGSMGSDAGAKTVFFQNGGLTEEQKEFNRRVDAGVPIIVSDDGKEYKTGHFKEVETYNSFTKSFDTKTVYVEDCNCNCSSNCNCSRNCNCTHNCNCDSYGGCYMFGGKGFRGNGISSGFTFVYCNSAPNYEKDGIIAPDTEEKKK